MMRKQRGFFLGMTIVLIFTFSTTLSWLYTKKLYKIVIQYDINTQNDQNSKYNHKKKIAIGVLVDWKHWKTDHKLPKLIKSIKYFNTTDILLFSDTNPVSKRYQNITHHKIHYVPIKFHFPQGFNSSSKSPFVKRSKWGYIHMCKFWFKDVWNIPIVQEYKYLMRFDTDSCMKNKKYQLIINDKYKYLHWKLMYETKFIDDFNKTILEYVSKHNIVPKNADLFKDYIESKGGIPMWYNNVEITDTEFMLSSEVQKFFQIMDDTHGQYKYRWGDALLRYATMALFTSPGEVAPLGMNRNYIHPCY